MAATYPAPAARQHLYNLLSANTDITSRAKVYPEQPLQTADYNFIYLDRGAGSLNRPVGTDTIEDSRDWDVHVVFDRNKKLSDRDVLIKEVIETLHKTRGDNIKGEVASCSVRDIFSLPYQVDADYYPQEIIRVHVYSKGN
jgi:hypothetical protein